MENGYDSDQKLHANLPSWHFVTDTYLWRLAAHLNARSRYERAGKKKTKGWGGACSCKSHNWQQESIISSGNIQENQAVSRCHGCHIPAPMMCLHVGAAVDFFLLAVLCHSKLFISGEATRRWHLDNKSNRHSIYRGKGHAGLWNESGNEIYNPGCIFFLNLEDEIFQALSTHRWLLLVIFYFWLFLCGSHWNRS